EYLRSKSMNKSKNLILIPLLLVVMVFASACAGAGPSSGKVVYYMSPTLFDEFQAGTNEMMLKFGKELGYEVRALNANNTSSTQVNKIDDAINQKPLAIILNAVDA